MAVCAMVMLAVVMVAEVVLAGFTFQRILCFNSRKWAT